MSSSQRAIVVLVVVAVILAVLVATRRGAAPEGEIRAAFDAEFLTRPDGYDGLAQAYGFRFESEPMQMDPGLMYRSAADGAVDVIDAFATDGRIAAYDLTVLEDDKRYFPPYYAAPLVRAELLEAHPEVKDILNRLGGRLSNEAMQQLNFRVDEKGEKARDVARDFLAKEGLVPEDAGDREKGDGDKVAIGGKQFTEQEILGEMMALLLEAHTDLRVVRRLNLGGTMICFNGLKSGDLHLYAEYTGTGLVNILKRDVIGDPDEAYRVVKDAFAEEYDLVWLEPFGFNNTYTLTMREEHAKELGISSISDLAAHVKDE